MKKTLSVRLDPALYAKVHTDPAGSAYIVSKALHQFYRSKEPNEKVYTNSYANVYNRDLVPVLQSQIDDLRMDKSMLMQQIQDKDKIIGLMSMGVVGRLKYLLSAKKD